MRASMVSKRLELRKSVVSNVSKGWVRPFPAKKKAEEREKRKTDKDLESDNGGGQRMNETTAAAAAGNRPIVSGKFDEENKFTSETMGSRQLPNSGEDWISRGHVCPRQESKNLDSNNANSVYKNLVPTPGPKYWSFGKPRCDQHSLGVCSMRKINLSVAHLLLEKMKNVDEVLNRNRRRKRRRRIGFRVFPGRGGFTKLMPIILAGSHAKKRNKDAHRRRRKTNTLVKIQ